MKKLTNCKWFAMGAAASLLLVTLTVPAVASTVTKTAQLAYNNIKITLNGNAVTPKDANGNVVEPFIIDGTTYLPVRAVASALSVNVGWDGNTNTVVLSTGNASASGTVLYDKSGVKITYQGIAAMEYGGEEVKLYIQNTSGTDYTIQAADESVNGIMTEGSLSCDVLSGKSAYTSIEFNDYYLKKNNIASVSTAEFRFRIIEKDDWSNTINSDLITVNK